MNNTAYLIFLDGEKHSIWNNKGDAVRQINTLEQCNASQCVTIEELPGVKSNNGIFFL